MKLSDYIASDLEAKLRRGELSLADLTLAKLGKRYQVSFTPVRRALDDLVQRGLLVRGENGRVSIQPGLSRPPADISAKESGWVEGTRRDAAEPPHSELPPAESPPAESPYSELPPVAPPKEVSDWERVLSGRIVRLSLLGKSIFLREESTAAKFGIGRTLLRQIFSRLSGRGLLQHVPRRGWRVRPFEPDDLADYIEVRVILELKAMDLARPRIDVNLLTEMLRGNTRGADVAKASADAQSVAPHPLDNRLHEYFIDTAGNRYIRDFFERHGDYYNQVFDLAAPELQVVQAMAEQHRRILRAAIDDQWLEAKAAMAEHIRAQLPIVSRLINQSLIENG